MENKDFEDFKEEIETRIQKIEDSISVQNEVIEELKLKKALEILEAVKEITKVALKLKEIELSNKFENGGPVGISQGGESVLSSSTLDKIRNQNEVIEEVEKSKINYIKESKLPLSELIIQRINKTIENPFEYKYTEEYIQKKEAARDNQELKKLYERGKSTFFKVGDQVIKNGDSDTFSDGSILDSVFSDGSILEVIGLYPYDDNYLCKSTQGNDKRNFVHGNELESLPKENDLKLKIDHIIQSVSRINQNEFKLKYLVDFKTKKYSFQDEAKIMDQWESIIVLLEAYEGIKNQDLYDLDRVKFCNDMQKMKNSIISIVDNSFELIENQSQK